MPHITHLPLTTALRNLSERITHSGTADNPHIDAPMQYCKVLKDSAALLEDAERIIRMTTGGMPAAQVVAAHDAEDWLRRYRRA